MPYLVRALLLDLLWRRFRRGRLAPTSARVRGMLGPRFAAYDAVPPRRLRMGCLPLGCLATLVLCVTVVFVLSGVIGALH